MSLLSEIKAAYMENWKQTGEIPQRITVSPRAFQAMMQEVETYRAVQLRAKEEDEKVVLDCMTLFGMKIEVPEDTGNGFVCVGGTYRQLNGKETGGQGNVSGTD